MEKLAPLDPTNGGVEAVTRGQNLNEKPSIPGSKVKVTETDILYNQGDTGGQRINFINARGDRRKQQIQKGVRQATQAGGWRGFGLNQVHNIGDSCCVVQSDEENDRDEDGQELQRDVVIDHHGAHQPD